MQNPFTGDNNLDVVDNSDGDAIFDDVEGASGFCGLESDSRQAQKHTVSRLLSVDEDVVVGESDDEKNIL